MIEFLQDWYLWLKALHIIFFTTWMAGLFYLPRLFVYHTRVKTGSDQDKLFQLMERKLLRIIMAPSSILVWVFGVALIFAIGWEVFSDGLWGWIKLGAVSLLTLYHHVLVRYWKAFSAGKNKHDEKFYRKINEIPSILLIIIVVMVVVRPF
ncbi:MAG: protoporphyrinogen oxidase HemJ [Proteobacteria bacterium]|nr:protoporphyrinogen oxidase HemJ [Pseudomonadota bacterium]